MGKKCYRCGQDRIVKNGVSTNGYQKYRCSYCGHCYTSKTELVNPQLAAFKATTRQAGPVRPLNHAKPASTVDLVLTVLLGWAGYWRFRQGQLGLGILWLLTGGVFIFGWIIDIILAAIAYLEQRRAAPQPLPAPAPMQRIPVAPVPAPAQPQKPPFPAALGEQPKRYEYTAVPLYTLPQEAPALHLLRMYGLVMFNFEPQNTYDPKAVYATLDGIKLGYLHRGTLQDMAHDFAQRGGMMIGILSGIDAAGVISVDVAFYE